MALIYFFFLSVFGIGTPSVSTPHDVAKTHFLEKEIIPYVFHDSLVDLKVKVNERSSDTIATYASEKSAIKELRIKLVEDLGLGKVSMNVVKTSFADHLMNRLIPHWYGTEWSFSGHTAIPKKGKIACGYFVSTTLRDMGLRLNRYRLAQKSPINEAKMLSCGSEIKTVTAENSETAIKKIDDATQEGIYFIGFDEGHVGFLLKQKGNLFLAHSNYLFPNAVCMERIEDSNVFSKFSVFHLVDISNNDLLIQRWLDDVEIL